KGECAKLKRKYLGPFLIIECRPKHNYMLKELASGKEMRRPVHANRLRSLKELPNDYRLRVRTRTSDCMKRLRHSVNWKLHFALAILFIQCATLLLARLTRACIMSMARRKL